MFSSQRVRIFLIATIVGIMVIAEGHRRMVKSPIITIDQAPYIVELRLNWGRKDHQCGGTLVSPRFVVTAAHCFDWVPKEEYIVVGNITSRSEEGQRRTIEELFIHPEYTRSITGNKYKDVAVFKLNSNMTGEFAKPVKLCDRYLEENDFIRVSGWGITEEWDERNYFPAPSEYLRSSRVRVLSQEQCVKNHGDANVTVTNDTLCAIGRKGEDACTTDSGGPGIHGGELCAVVSSGIGCGRAKYGGIYVRIDQVRDFIVESMKK